MTKAKRKPKPTIAPTPWDMGAMGQANRIGLVIEAVEEPHPITGKPTNPNGVKRARRVDMLDHWHRHGVISTGGYNAAVALRNALEQTQRSPGTSFEQDRVDSSPKPDHAVAIQIDRISAYHKINRLVISTDDALITHCISGGIPATFRVKGKRPYLGPRYREGLAELSAALDRLARAMEK